jgi:hypothetical protein
VLLIPANLEKRQSLAKILLPTMMPTYHKPINAIFIHDNSDFHSFTHFFHHLEIKLFGASTNQLTIGSDEEKALVNAIKT